MVAEGQNMFNKLPTEIKETANCKFPRRTQNVGRCVKLVNEAFKSVCGEKRRDGFTQAKFEAQDVIPSSERQRQDNSKKIFENFAVT